MRIAIDGPAGVGKSSVAKACADEFGFNYLNSGNLYRAVTHAHLKAGSDPEDGECVITTARSINVTLEANRILVNGSDVTDELHRDDVDAWVAQHSAIIPVRHIIVDMLRNMTQGLDVVVEGRDITTVVFPDAEVKVYLDASIEVRAQRRHKQGTSEMSLDELRQNIRMRDEIDRNKAEGSLKVAADASYIDTSRLTMGEVCEKVAELIRNSKTRDNMH